MYNISTSKKMYIKNEQIPLPEQKQTDTTMPAYKLSIYQKLEEWAAQADSGDFIWVSISDECFTAMKQDPSYESWVLNKIRSIYTSCKGDRYDTIAVLKFGPQKSDYQETIHTTPDRKTREYLRQQEQNAKEELRKKRKKQYEKKLLQQKWLKQEIEKTYVRLKILDHQKQIQKENEALRFHKDFYPADHSASLYAAAKRRASAYEASFLYHDCHI